MKRVSFSLTSVQGSVSKPVRMEALTTEKICTPLEPVEISLEKYPHLTGLTLADSYPCGSVNVDILIGADFYFAFMSGECKNRETTNTPTAVESTLGWIVGGPFEGLSWVRPLSRWCQLSALTQSLTVLINFGSYNLSELSTKEMHICS